MTSNCSETCESSFVFGAIGTCVKSADANLTTDSEWTCLCPAGYSGLDDWKRYDDCRVNETLQKWMWIIPTCLCLVLAVAGCFAFFHLLCYWDRMSVSKLRSTRFSSPDLRPSRKTSKSTGKVSKTSSFSSDNDYMSPAISKREDKVRRKNRRRQNFSLFVIYLIVSYGASALLYYVPFFAGKYRWEANYYQDAGVTFAANSIFAGLWFFFYVWYSQLPSLRLYSRLFDVDSFLIHYPKAIKYSVYARIVLINVVNFILLFGWIYVVDRSTETRDRLDRVFLIFCCIVIVDFATFAFILLNILRKLFNQLKTLSDEAHKRGVTSGSERKTFKGAIATIELMFRAVVFLAPIALLIFGLAAFHEPVRSRTYLAINFCVCVGNLAGMVILFIFVRRLKGAKGNGSESANNSSKTATTGDEKLRVVPGTPKQTLDDDGFV